MTVKQDLNTFQWPITSDMEVWMAKVLMNQVGDLITYFCIGIQVNSCLSKYLTKPRIALADLSSIPNLFKFRMYAFVGSF